MPPPDGQQRQSPYPPPPQLDLRSPAYPSLQGLRGGFCDDRRPTHRQEPYLQGPYFTYSYCRQPPPRLSPLPKGHQNYRGPAGGIYEYSQVGPDNPSQATQAMPRKRALIACQHCRRRKIRCSGYQSDPGGKCRNCARINLQCVFQPLSSPSSAALIPVSAVVGGVPLGTQLFGAYGQPLVPGTVSTPSQQPPGRPYHQNANALPPANYRVPVQPPMGSFSSYGDARADGGGQAAGRRRCRTSEEQEGYRLAPPRGVLEQDPRRRSPTEFSNRGRPGGIGCPPYLGPRQSPHNLPQPTASGGHAASTPGCYSPASQDGSSGAVALVRWGQQHGQPQQSGNRSIMSLGNLVEQNSYQQDWMSD